MPKFLKIMSASLILSLAVSSQAMAQTGDRYFSADSITYATEAKADQAANAHKDAIKKLKKALKLKTLKAYETSAMQQMLGASYYATGKPEKAIEAFEGAISAGGLRADEVRSIRVNIAQLNIAAKNYGVGAEQLETYFREGGPQKASLVKLVMTSHMRAGNRQAAVPWADVMVRNNYAKTRLEHDTLLYLYDTPEKRADQIRVVTRMIQMWPEDAALQVKSEGLKRKAKSEAAG